MACSQVSKPPWQGDHLELHQQNRSVQQQPWPLEAWKWGRRQMQPWVSDHLWQQAGGVCRTPHHAWVRAASSVLPRLQRLQQQLPWQGQTGAVEKSAEVCRGAYPSECQLHHGLCRHHCPRHPPLQCPHQTLQQDGSHCRPCPQLPLQRLRNATEAEQKQERCC
mmetsp:Transcript_64187/g.172350  ORF Transcript_64187/g.172350 Transcript_64187/m.172350 type:complete len:164 (-) Transcript_64187:1467-1958(-)